MTQKAVDLKPVASWNISGGRTHLFFHTSEKELMEFRNQVACRYTQYQIVFRHCLRSGRLNGNTSGYFLQVDCIS